MNIRLLFLISLVFTLTTSLYEADSPVFKLTQRNFKDTVLMSDEFWLVQFYAPWCGHCKKAVPEYIQTAQILKGIVNVGAADMTTDPGTGSPYGVSGYPTIKLFGPNKDKPIDYSSGNRTFQAFVEFCLKQMKSQIEKRKKTVQSQTEEL